MAAKSVMSCREREGGREGERERETVTRGKEIDGQLGRLTPQ